MTDQARERKLGDSLRAVGPHPREYDTNGFRCRSATPAS